MMEMEWILGEKDSQVVISLTLIQDFSEPLALFDAFDGLISSPKARLFPPEFIFQSSVTSLPNFVEYCL